MGQNICSGCVGVPACESMYFIGAAVELLGSAMFIKLFFRVVIQMLPLTCLAFVTLDFLRGLATSVPPLNE